MSVVSTENATHYQWGNNCDGWHLANSETLSIIQERVPVGASEVRHYHEQSEQFFYVLSGVATLEREGIVHELHPQQGLHIEPGQSHQLRNEHDQELHFLVISTPPSHGDRVEVG